MKDKIKVLCAFGTRPEVIKIAPVIYELNKYPERFETKICITAQHREMLDQMLTLFKIHPDIDLNLMKKNQTLSLLTSKIILTMTKVLKRERPEIFLVQGDTTSAMATGLAAFYLGIPIGHIEAGLRTYDIYNPFPEEINRRILAVLSTYHFAPTIRAVKHLIQEGIDSKSVFLTGNTIVDAIYWILKQPISESISNIFSQIGLPEPTKCEKETLPYKLIVVTVHRRESFGYPIEQICKALRIIVERNRDVLLVFPVHLNPNVRNTARRFLSNHPQIKLLEPIQYDAFIHLLNCSYLILTDSGGIQEEASVLCKPVLVLRKVTERPEIVETGLAKLVGTDPEKIVQETENLLYNQELYKSIIKKVEIFGDGKAAKRIVSILMNKLINKYTRC